MTKPVINGLDASINVVAVNMLSTIGSGGEMSLEFTDEYMAIQATIEGELMDDISVQLANYALHVWDGEARDMILRLPHWGTLVCLEGIRKLQAVNCNYNPVKHTGTIDTVNAQVMIDRKTTALAQYSAVQAIAMEKGDILRHIVHPTAALSQVEDSGGTPFSPDTETNDADVLYYVPPTVDATHRWITSHELAAKPNYKLSCGYAPFLKDGSVISEVVLTSRADIMLNAGSTNNPEIMIYNYDTTSWVTLYEFTEDDHGAASGLSNLVYHVDIALDILEALSVSGADFLTDYLDPQGGANTSGFIEYRMKLSLMVGSSEAPSGIDAGNLDLLEVTFVLDTDQTGAIGLGEIDTTSDNSVTVTDVGYSINGFPRSDGWCKGDIYKLANLISDTVAQVENDSGIGLTLNVDSWDADGAIELNDLTMEKIYTFLNRWADTMNAVIYQHLANIYLTNSVFTDTSVVLEWIDCVDYLTGGVVFTISTRNLRDSIIAVGGGNLSHTEAISPEFAFGALGGEVAVYNNPAVRTVKQATEFANNKALAHTTAFRRITLTLNFDKPKQSLSTLKAGRLITLQLPTTASPTICDFSGANKLLIESMAMEWTEGEDQLVTLILQRRYLP